MYLQLVPLSSWIVFQCVHIVHLVHTATDRYLGCFDLLTYANSIQWKFMRRFVWTLVDNFWVWVGNGIAGSHVNSTCLWRPDTLSPNCYTCLVPMLSFEDSNFSASLSNTKRTIMVTPVGMGWHAVVLIGSSLMTLMLKIFSCALWYLWVSGEIGF